jgi:hypothetical protein
VAEVVNRTLSSSVARRLTAHDAHKKGGLRRATRRFYASRSLGGCCRPEPDLLGFFRRHRKKGWPAARRPTFMMSSTRRRTERLARCAHIRL